MEISLWRTKKQANSSAFPPEVLRLFDRYAHGLIARRDFLRGASGYAALTGVTALKLLDARNPRFAAARKVAPADQQSLADLIPAALPSRSDS